MKTTSSRPTVPAALAAILLLAGAPPAFAAGTAPEDGYLPDWQAVLADYTRSVERTVGTEVDYRGLREGAGAERWRRLLAGLEHAHPPGTRAERLALWINAYNILAIDTVLRAWPVDSIRDAGSFFRPVWRKPAGVVAGREVTLHAIEHEILRPMGEPRIHSAIVCASTSCPSLRRTPFRADAVDAQLDEQMRSWLASDTKGLRVDPDDALVTASRIFDWFGEDFESLGGVRATLTRYAPSAVRPWMEQNAADAELDFFDYDWSLNDWKRGESPTTFRAP